MLQHLSNSLTNLNLNFSSLLHMCLQQLDFNVESRQHVSHQLVLRNPAHWNQRFCLCTGRPFHHLAYGKQHAQPKKQSWSRSRQRPQLSAALTPAHARPRCVTLPPRLSRRPHPRLGLSAGLANLVRSHGRPWAPEASWCAELRPSRLSAPRRRFCVS